MASDEAAFAERLALIRWGEDWACAGCGGRERYHLASRPRVFQCVACKTQCSVTAGTVLEGMKVKLAVWFRAVELFSRNEGISSRALARQLPISPKSAFALAHRIRNALQGDDGLLVGVAEWCRRAVKCARAPRVARSVNVVIAIDAMLRMFVRVGKHVAQPAEGPMEEAPVFNVATGAHAFVHRRLQRTHRQVSGRYVERYVRGDAFLWRESLRLPKEATVAEEVAARAMAVMRRCVRSAPTLISPLAP